MNFKRALGFAFVLYIVSFLGFFVTLLLPGEQSLTEVPPLATFVIGWIINIPVVLLLAKWYFKKVTPTAKAGFQLGVITIAFSLLLDGISIVGTYMAGQPLDTFAMLYSDWKLYATVIEIILLTTYAGYEFDATYTAPTKIDTQDNQ